MFYTMSYYISYYSSSTAVKWQSSGGRLSSQSVLDTVSYSRYMSSFTANRGQGSAGNPLYDLVPKVYCVHIIS